MDKHNLMTKEGQNHPRDSQEVALNPEELVLRCHSFLSAGEQIPRDAGFGRHFAEVNEAVNGRK